MAIIRIVTTRAPGLIPSLVKEIDHATNPVVLIPESFTLACETEIVNRSRDKGFFDLKIFSPSSSPSVRRYAVSSASSLSHRSWLIQQLPRSRAFAATIMFSMAQAQSAILFP